MRRLRAVREEQGLSLPELGRRLDFDHSTIGHWETGKRRPTESDFKKLLRALRQPPEIVEDWLDEVALTKIAAALDERGVEERERDHLLHYAGFALSKARGQPREQRRAPSS